MRRPPARQRRRPTSPGTSWKTCVKGKHEKGHVFGVQSSQEASLPRGRRGGRGATGPHVERPSRARGADADALLLLPQLPRQGLCEEGRPGGQRHPLRAAVRQDRERDPPRAPHPRPGRGGQDAAPHGRLQTLHPEERRQRAGGRLERLLRASRGEVRGVPRSEPQAAGEPQGTQGLFERRGRRLGGLRGVRGEASQQQGAQLALVPGPRHLPRPRGGRRGGAAHPRVPVRRLPQGGRDAQPRCGPREQDLGGPPQRRDRPAPGARRHARLGHRAAAADQ